MERFPPPKKTNNKEKKPYKMHTRPYAVFRSAKGTALQRRYSAASASFGFLASASKPSLWSK